MKKTNLKIAALFLGIVIGLSTVGCSSDTEETPTTNNNNQEQVTEDKLDTTNPPSTEQDTEQTHSGNITQDAYNEKINYYMALVSSLQNELVSIKEEKYIEQCEYKLKIAELEQQVQSLLKTIESISTGTQITPVDPPQTENPDFDKVVLEQEYKYTESNGQITITGYTGKSTDIEIPRIINGMPVIAIGESAFQNCDLTSVVIPSGVRLIDWFAFAGCTSLKSITVPHSVTSVSYGAFDYCPKSMIIICEKESYIEAYALSWGMTVDAR